MMLFFLGWIQDASDEEPMKAHMPSWANNPDYTLHATTSKPDDSQHKAIFGVFDTIKEDSSNKQQQQPAQEKDQAAQQADSPHPPPSAQPSPKEPSTKF